ncbi:methyltransferase domain-containing protein [Nonomuraea sp. NPDC049695]|uniref:class I SAM-dependent methyltransferase n=1 Tax=Nonomuraea sp. NPDC049695 TaxID=3154734 RepID=UPI00341D74EA
MTASDEIAAVKHTQAQEWCAVAQSLEGFVDELEAALSSATHRLIELAALRPGRRVLDLGTGYGEPTLSVAPLLRPGGHVTGIDLAGEMIELARRRAGGEPDVEFRVGDYDTLDLPDASADAVLARFSLMFAPEPARTFAEIRRVLAPGGVLAATVWASPELNGFATGTLAVARALGAAPPPGAPGPFAMADLDTLIGQLREAGFADVSSEELVIPFRFAGLDRYVQVTLAVTAPRLLAAARQRLGSDAAVADLISTAARSCLDGDGTVVLPSTAFCVRAVAPAQR